jgi:hypothetical protein
MMKKLFLALALMVGALMTAQATEWKVIDGYLEGVGPGLLQINIF